MKLLDPVTADDFNDVWVLVEISNNRLHQVTRELLGISRELANELTVKKEKKNDVVCIVLGKDVRDIIDECFRFHADKVIVIDDPFLEYFNDERYGSAITRLMDTYKPDVFISGATSKGRSIMPRLAVLSESGLTADCTGLAIDKETGLLLQTRPAYGGNIIATIKCENFRPQMSTVRQGVFKAPEQSFGKKRDVIIEKLLESEQKSGLEVLSEEKNSDVKIDLHEAGIIVSGGRGMQGPEGFAILKEFAGLVNGAVGASRATIDSGWIPYPHQVGQTGQTVQPKIYIACGISGQIQHLVGMQSSDFIIAINKDPEAPIMKLADVAVVGDLFEVVPEIIKLLKAG